MIGRIEKAELRVKDNRVRPKIFLSRLFVYLVLC